jgi:choline dehydrogenase-like flavoprotein
MTREPLPTSFRDARTIDRDSILNCDVCIVGAGAAGVTLALQFQGARHHVCVLEAGGLESDPVTTSLYDLESTGLPIRPRARERYMGGTTNAWGGGVAVFGDIDLGPRSWVPLSTWPIGRNELNPYWRQACAQLGVPDLTSPDVAPRAARRGFLLRTPTLDTAYVYWAKRPLRFGEPYVKAVRSSQNISTLLHANVTELVLDRTGTRVDRLVVQTIDGGRFSVRPTVTVLACGGIENARLLLACRRQRSKGLGNNADQVGRYFMEHPKGQVGVVHVSPGIRKLPHPSYWSGRRVRVRLGVRLSDDAQRRHAAHNSYLRFHPTLARDGRGVEALRELLGHRVRALSDGRVLRDLGSNLPEVAGYAWFRMLNRGPVRTMEIDNYMEQEPRPENRVSLSDKLDMFGKPLARLEWSISESEKRTMRILHALLDKEMRRRSLGWVDSPLLSGEAQAWAIDRDASHHLGTTRMGDDTRTSVVDRDCRIHTVNNVYIAGSSVFPTGGYANPTLTIVALALRLAEHLKEKVLT